MQKLKKKILPVLLRYFPKTLKWYYFKELNTFNIKTINQFSFEPEIIILEELLKTDKKAVFFDIGANKGEYLFVAEKHLLRENIHAFEPNPKLYFKLKYLFNKIKVNEVALSDENGESAFKIPFLNQIKDDSLGTLNIDTLNLNETSCELVKVKTQTLDRYCFTKNIARLDIIKIDVEGFELQVLKGGKQLFQIHQPVIILELEKRHHNKKVIKLADEIIQQYSVKSKYKAFYYDPIQYRMKELTEEPDQEMKNWGTKKYINNFIFIPEQHPYFFELPKLKFGN